MKVPVKLHRPFGPYVLESVCPQNIMDSLNNYAESIEKDSEKKFLYSSEGGNIPNLLLRDFESIFISKKFAEDIGLSEYAKKLAKIYFETSEGHVNINPSLSIIKGLEAFPCSNKTTYVDAWINRYYAGDFTPMHEHGADISGIIFLKYPEKELEKEQFENATSIGLDEYEEGLCRENGRVSFHYGFMQSSFNSITYAPKQFVGKTLIFPSWLRHLVYPMKTKNIERRTFSFNMNINQPYSNF